MPIRWSRKAAELDTSVSALVRRFLVDLAAGESEAERLWSEERALRAKITDFRGGDRQHARADWTGCRTTSP
jgi:hypothetical protein